MGMRKQLAKGAGYIVAPKLTFTALNPGKAAAAKAASWTLDRVSPARRRRARNRSRMTGLGAAAVAVPVGMWLGRRYWTRRSNEAQFTMPH
jgi:hypothetical protein